MFETNNSNRQTFSTRPLFERPKPKTERRKFGRDETRQFQSNSLNCLLRRSEKKGAGPAMFVFLQQNATQQNTTPHPQKQGYRVEGSLKSHIVLTFSSIKGTTETIYNKHITNYH